MLHLRMKNKLSNLYLGGPAETSHLKIPLVPELTFLMIRCVGEDLELTTTPGNGYVVTVGGSPSEQKELISEYKRKNYQLKWTIYQN